MYRYFFMFFLLIALPAAGQDTLIYHAIRTDSEGHILPWYDDDPGTSYDHVIQLVWSFWDTMRVDMNGLPYYMNHQVWRPDFNDPRGLGGDQLQMALSSWRLLYAYSGNERVKENMRFLADYYLTHSLSAPDAEWPNLPYPYNTLVYSGYYDGDMVLGEGYLQPDKAGSFGRELVQLFKMMSAERYPHATEKRYLDAAVDIANTLAAKVQTGNADASPLPFKVNATTGEIGKLKSNTGDRSDAGLSNYTTNWSGTLELWLDLIELGTGDTTAYRHAFDTVLAWMKEYPMQNNKWGPFFEDIPGWSDTQINAMTWARFIMNHPEYFPEWEADVRRIIDWVYSMLGNEEWADYGVTVVNEQTVYQTPGNSHTARQAADELLLAALTGDLSRKEHAIRQLNWATYMVDTDGKNRYPRDENWLTDGYGDYVRHYLRAMAAAPELAPNEEHLLFSTSVVQHVEYPGQINKFLTPTVRGVDPEDVAVTYRTFDPEGREIVRLPNRPSAVLLEGQPIAEREGAGSSGWYWTPMEKGGYITITRHNGSRVIVMY